jgi:low affinity Fe/Cu permease
MNSFFEKLAKKCTLWFGSSLAFSSAILLIVLWLVAGPIYGWSDSHSLFVNTVTTVFTFLMVFLIQRTQNKDSFALQMKLNEIIAAHPGCSNRLINVEDFSEEEIIKLYRRYKKLSQLAKLEDTLTHAHTIEEIEED